MYWVESLVRHHKGPDQGSNSIRSPILYPIGHSAFYWIPKSSFHFVNGGNSLWLIYLIFVFLHSCPQDSTVQYHHNSGIQGLHRFSLQTFQFVNVPDPFVYIHCKVTDEDILSCPDAFKKFNKKENYSLYIYSLVSKQGSCQSYHFGCNSFTTLVFSFKTQSRHSTI